jgi:hypothetical protein
VNTAAVSLTVAALCTVAWAIGIISIPRNMTNKDRVLIGDPHSHPGGKDGCRAASIVPAVASDQLSKRSV